MENKCCANCKNFVKYEIEIEGASREKCGCKFYELSAEMPEVDVNKCNCDSDEGWEAWQ